jgi:hypothetical protein
LPASGFFNSNAEAVAALTIKTIENIKMPNFIFVPQTIKSSNPRANRK